MTSTLVILMLNDGNKCFDKLSWRLNEKCHDPTIHLTKFQKNLSRGCWDIAICKSRSHGHQKNDCYVSLHSRVRDNRITNPGGHIYLSKDKNNMNSFEKSHINNICAKWFQIGPVLKHSNTIFFLEFPSFVKINSFAWFRCAKNGCRIKCTDKNLWF